MRIADAGYRSRRGQGGLFLKSETARFSLSSGHPSSNGKPESNWDPTRELEGGWPITNLDLSS